MILTASIGAGHNSAARAVAAELQQRSDRLDVQVVDLLDHCRAFFRFYYVGGYFFSMTRTPRIYGLGYWLSDRPDRAGRTMGERLRMAWERWMLRPLAEMLKQTQPDLIINTHYVQGPLIARLIDTGQLNCRQVTVVTDVAMHRWWYSERVSHWFVPQEVTARRLEGWGIDSSDCTVSGLPIHPKWDRPLNIGQIRETWSLSADRPIVLISGGAEFTVGPIVKITRDLVRRCPEAMFLVLAGRNKKLLARLTNLSQQVQQGRLRVLGFTDRINELVELSDLVLTKPGGLITAECLSKSKAMLLINPVPGQEGGNAKFYASQGVARIARGRKQIVQTTLDLLAQPEKLQDMAARAAQLHRRGRQNVAAAVLERLSDPAD